MLEIIKNQIQMLNNYSTAKYGLYQAYGKVQLVRLYENGGQRGITGFCPKPELNRILSAMITYAAIEQCEKNAWHFL